MRGASAVRADTSREEGRGGGDGQRADRKPGGEDTGDRGKRRGAWEWDEREKGTLTRGIEREEGTGHENVEGDRSERRGR